MAGGRNLTVYLTSDVSKFSKGLKRGESSLRNFGKKVGIGVAAAGALAVAVGVDAVKAAMAQEKANKKLGKTLDNMGLGDQTDAVLDNIAAMQSQYGVSEDDLIPAFEKLVGVTKDTGKANDLLKSSMDLAAGAGIPLEAAADKVAKAMAGNIRPLEKVAPGLKLLKLNGDDAAGAMAYVNKQFGGQAAANAESTAGTMERLSLAAGEISESLGTGILDGFVGGDADGAVENLEQAAENAERVGRAIGGLGTNAMGWASDFLLGLEAISYGIDTWSLDVISKVNGVRDALGLISDQEGQRLSDNERRLQTARDFEAATVVNGGRLSGTGGGNLSTGAVAGGSWGDFYANGPRSNDPTRYKNRADDASGRAAARAAASRARP